MAAFTVGVVLVVTACGGDDINVAINATTPPSAEAFDDSSSEIIDDDLVEDTTEQSDGASADTTTSDRTIGDESVPATTSTAEASADAGVAQRIVSLSPTATEMLYAIGAGAQVLAVDDLSDYPPPATEKMQGLSALEPNIETIAGLEPDLVITDGTNAALLEQLESLGIAHWEGPAATSFDDVYEQIEQLGAVTGRPAEAASVVKRIQVEIDVAKAGLPELDEPLSYYHELDDRYHSVTSDTFVGAVYGEFGLVNIADGSGTDSSYPQLDAEHIIDQDPDLIFLACTTSCGYTAADVSDRPGWSDLTAVRTGGVIAVDEDIASRWGPRVVDYLHTVGEAVDAVAASTLDG